ncbi:glycoside hydrolase family 25 protein [Telmatospirillum sp.]|uniref:glycoside hydrolase family 25 protein n=1 Tax=Telmatospirillum sp. TaxID=2079197 RepID=UPI00283F8009|nr:glycoside hydrolase family 25 protein [Telmatospirillum sp.]MDR3435861.1 glycoside hydrolase family 25 protein [Telmatospirillum sp.]
MISRRRVLAGLLGIGNISLIGCSNRPASPVTASQPAPAQPPNAMFAPNISSARIIDAMIDISHSVRVSDFGLARERSNILAVFHKATEGGDWQDPLYAERRAKAKDAGMLWGAYHFGTRQYSGADQANNFLATAQPGPDTLLALDLELNERIPANTMSISQAEEFVQTIQTLTGRLPLLYTHPSWADGKRTGPGGRSLGAAISPQSILAQCDLWLADYRNQPQLPIAWATKGWRFWQYAGEGARPVAPAESPVRGVSGVERCDRNLFLGDTVALTSYWGTGTGGTAPGINRQLISSNI